jgi:hypothetical protein
MSLADNDRHIYTVQPNGEDMRQITVGHGEMPVWSPIFGSYIAFLRDRQIWVTDLDGNYLKQVPTGGVVPVTLGDWW